MMYAAIDWDRRAVIGFFSTAHLASLALSQHLGELRLADVSVVAGGLND